MTFSVLDVEKAKDSFFNSLLDQQRELNVYQLIHDVHALVQHTHNHNAVIVY